MQKPIIVLTGPTASGKTAMSYALAEQFKGEILAIDSMTVYQGMDIGTDKPARGTNVSKKGGIFYIKGVPHHLIDIVAPSEEMNAAILRDYALKAIKEIHARGNIPFLVGGSTLYVDSIVYDYKMPEVRPNMKLRKAWEDKTVEELFKELVGLDPDCEWTIDRHNKRRVIRALEVVKTTGGPFAQQKGKALLPENVLYLAVQKDRTHLYDKINARVDQMMEEGFLEEVGDLYKRYDHNTAMQAAGYRQLIDYLDGITTLQEAVEKTKQIHRNFAKRQISWLKRNQDVRWIKNSEEAKELIQEFLG